MKKIRGNFFRKKLPKKNSAGKFSRKFFSEKIADKMREKCTKKFPEIFFEKIPREKFSENFADKMREKCTKKLIFEKIPRENFPAKFFRKKFGKNARKKFPAKILDCILRHFFEKYFTIFLKK